MGVAIFPLYTVSFFEFLQKHEHCFCWIPLCSSMCGHIFTGKEGCLHKIDPIYNAHSCMGVWEFCMKKVYLRWSYDHLGIMWENWTEKGSTIWMAIREIARQISMFTVKKTVFNPKSYFYLRLWNWKSNYPSLWWSFWLVQKFLKRWTQVAAAILFRLLIN